MYALMISCILLFYWFGYVVYRRIKKKAWIDCVYCVGYVCEWRRLCAKNQQQIFPLLIPFSRLCMECMYVRTVHIYLIQKCRNVNLISCFSFLFFSTKISECEFNKIQHVHLNTQLLHIWFGFECHSACIAIFYRHQ